MYLGLSLAWKKPYSGLICLSFNSLELTLSADSEWDVSVPFFWRESMHYFVLTCSSSWVYTRSCLWHRIVIQARQAGRLHMLTGRYDNPTPESTISTSQGLWIWLQFLYTLNLVSEYSYKLNAPPPRCIGEINSQTIPLTLLVVTGDILDTYTSPKK